MYRTILTIGLILMLFGGVTAKTIKIPTDYSTIQAGINAASKGDTVLVADGTYYENINFKGKAITVASQFLIDGDTAHIDNTVINGSKPSHPDTGSVALFISGEDTTSVLCGFTITGGTGSHIALYRRGGGICIFYSGACIVNNKIVSNQSAAAESVYGGGISAGDPENNSHYIIIEKNLIAKNNAISKSNASYGGGIDVRMGNFRIVDNIISHNFVKSISMPYCYGPSCRLAYVAAKSKFRGNTISYNDCEAIAPTGGMVVGPSEDGFTIEKNYFRGNKGAAGGAPITWDGNVIIQNNIFYDNWSKDWGGAIYIMSNAPFVSNVQLINNTIVQNKAVFAGGGLFTTNSAPRVMNTIFWGNSASNGPQTHRESGTLDVIYSDVQGGLLGRGNIGLDPAFVPNDTLFHLSENSPCIDKGISSTTIGGMAYC